MNDATLIPPAPLRASAARAAPQASVGDLLRAWRTRRRVSQLELAAEAAISPRHMSFVETGRSQPSRELVLRLADRLQMPLRERNALLHAAGYAPLFAERALTDPALAPAREAIDLVLRGHEPYPALAVDRHWIMLAANRAVAPLLNGIPARLLEPPLNVLRLSLHPEGIAPRIVNYADWREHLFARLKRDLDLTGDARTAALRDELAAYPVPEHARLQRPDAPATSAMVIPLRLRSEAGVLSFLSTVTVFGTPVDVTLSEIAIESFFPADAGTATALRAMVG
jgi:transcriptional regulator with XRE-family HTH domain